MFDTVKDYAYSMKERVKETVVSYTSKNEIDKILIEATTNENWNIANTKLQSLADACYNQEECTRILQHFKSKLESPSYEWRRILKSLNAMEYLLKNGPPYVQQDLRNDMFKITTLQNFTYYEENLDKGSAVRDRTNYLQEILTDPRRLDQERQLAVQQREKFYPRSGGFGEAQYNYSYQQQISNHGFDSGNISNQEDVGKLSNIAKNIGGIATGIGSYIQSGISYVKGDQSQPDQLYNNGQGVSGGINGAYYNPPGGQPNGSEDIIKYSAQAKWGPQEVAKSMNYQAQNNQMIINKQVPQQSSNQKGSVRKQSSSSSSEDESSSSEDEKKQEVTQKPQIQQPKIENLLQIEQAPAQKRNESAFNFIGQSNNSQQQLKNDSMPGQEKFFFLNNQQSQQSNPLLTLSDLKFTPESQNTSQSLFQNLNIKSKSVPVEEQKQKLQQEQQPQAENHDTWAIGKGLVNFNLNETNSHNQDAKSKAVKQATQAPVYIKTINDNSAQPKFVPGILMGGQQYPNNGSVGQMGYQNNMNSQQQNMYYMNQQHQQQQQYLQQNQQQLQNNQQQQWGGQQLGFNNLKLQ